MFVPFVVSAPGKTILFGEHAVVYGKAAIATSIDLRTFCLAMPSTRPQLRLTLPDVDVDTVIDTEKLPVLNPEDLAHPADIQGLVDHYTHMDYAKGRVSILAFLYLYSCIIPKDMRGLGIELSVRSHIPVGAGLGSSASFSVCVAAALLNISGKLMGPGKRQLSPEDLATINKWAFDAEQVIHGTPSGIDNTVSTYGGFIYYQKGRETQTIQSKHPLRVIITNTRAPRNTRALVSGVRELWTKYKNVVDPIFDSIHNISIMAYRHIHAASDLRSPTSAACDGATTASLDEYRAFEETLEDLVRLNHSLLASLRVSHPSLESVVSITNECGLASKLTGAGGGGCALTLLPHFATADQIQAVKSALEVHGFDQYQTTVGGEGVWLTTLDEENTKATTTLISMRSFLELKDDQLVTLARSQTTKVQLAEKIKGGSGSSNGNNIGPAGATAVTSGIIVPSTAVPHF